MYILVYCLNVCFVLNFFCDTLYIMAYRSGLHVPARSHGGWQAHAIHAIHHAVYLYINTLFLYWSTDRQVSRLSFTHGRGTWHANTTVIIVTERRGRPICWPALQPRPTGACYCGLPGALSVVYGLSSLFELWYQSWASGIIAVNVRRTAL